jgi:pyruvyltransferase
MILYKHINPETDMNVGDNLSFYLLNKILNKEIKITTNPNDEGKLISVGSILHSAKDNDVIWGAGIRERTDKFSHNIKVLSVRGLLTEFYLNKKNIKCPKIYGDPALLLPKFYNPKINKTHKFGIIPHYIDLNHELLFNLNNSEIKIISSLNNIEDFIDEILSVEYVLSSSLHGLIISDAYKIPNIRLSISNNKSVIGSDLKFKDYYSGVNRKIQDNYHLKDLDLNKINKLKYNREIIFDECNLINSIKSY